MVGKVKKIEMLVKETRYKRVVISEADYSMPETLNDLVSLVEEVKSQWQYYANSQNPDVWDLDHDNSGVIEFDVVEGEE
tara:strand:- start:11643 stop:11879 length:237 start_codon:yes stop_codon:yes gene_type:complete